MSIFLEHKRPVVTTMLKSTNTKDIIFDVERAIKEGTDAFCLEIELMETKSRTASDFKDIFAAMGDKPAYITDYHRLNINDTEQNDDELTEEMLLALSCGAKLFDVRGDLFDIQPDELTLDDKAVYKQIELIKEVHRLGGEVIMSSHPLRFLNTEYVLKIAKAQESVSLSAKENVQLEIQGRHDPCIVPRAVPVVEAAAAIAIYDLILGNTQTGRRK